MMDPLADPEASQSAETEEGEDRPNVGPCKDCQFFDVERADEEATDETLAPCLHPDLEEFELVVSGDSGCNLFEPAEELDDKEEDDEKEEPAAAGDEALPLN